MRRLLVSAALLLGAVPPAASPAAVPSAAPPPSWASQANRICLVWLAKAKQEFGSPATTQAQLFGFAVKAKTLESRELVQLQRIPGRTLAGTEALASVKVDIAEVGSAITAWNAGKPSRFTQILRTYLNDHRPRTAFARAGATKCG